MHSTRIPLQFDAERPVLRMEVQTMRLDVTPVEAGEAPYAEVFSKSEDAESALSAVVENGAVVLRGPFGPWQWADTKRVVLHVPKQVRAKIVNDFGRVRIERLEGCDLTVMSQAGAVQLESVHGRLTLSVESGSLTGNGVGGTFEVRATAGSIRLGIDSLDVGYHSVRASMGSIRIELAKGIDVKIDSATVLGSARSTYPSNDASPTTLKLDADLGSVRVGEGGEDPRHGDWHDWRRLWANVVSTVTTEITDAIKPPPRPRSDAELRKVLELVQAGKLTAADAERLIHAMS